MKFSNRISKSEKNLTEEILVKANKIPGLISLAGGTPQFIIPQKYYQQIFDTSKNNPKIFQYGKNSQGDPELREIIANDLSKEFNQDISPESILITSGSTSSIFSILQAFLNPNDEVLMFSPHWSVYNNQCRLSGGVVKEVLLDENNSWEIDFKLLKKKYSKKSKIILFNDPVNPTGTTFSQKTKKQLLSFAQNNDLIVLADETYRHLTFNQQDFSSIMTLPSADKHIILCRSFSKDFSLSGFRLGFIYAQPTIISTLSKIHLAMNLMSPTFSQELGKILYQSKNQIIQLFQKRYNQRKKIVCKRLDKLSAIFDYVSPVAGYFVFPKYKLKMDTLSFFKYLLKSGVAIRPGIEFGLGGQNHIRLSFTGDIDKINLAFDKMEGPLMRSIL